MRNLQKLNLWGGFLPFILSLGITVAIVTVLNFLPPALPLFYSLAWGDAQLATHQQFFIIPASISAITLLNLVISWQLHSSQAFFKKALLLSSIVLSFIMTIAFIKIVSNFI